MEKTNLELLKEKYSEIQLKHNLPSFQELNEDFSIEKAAESESDLLIREIRKYVADKLVNYQRFIEAILNPSHASMFIFSVIKSLGADEKKTLEYIYKRLSKVELSLIELDVSFSEEKEAEFIKNLYSVWQEIKSDLLKVIGKAKENWDNESVKGINSFVG